MCFSIAPEQYVFTPDYLIIFPKYIDVEKYFCLIETDM